MRTRKESQTILIGAALGAFAGAALAVIYGRWRKQQGLGAKQLTTGQVVRLGSSFVVLVRQFLDLLS